jgi:hypothetical protein
MVPLLQTFEGGPSLNEADVRSFEKKYGLSLPTSYQEFLLTTNGGRPTRDLVPLSGLEGNPFSRIHVFFGLKDPVESCNLDWNLEVFRDRIPANILPIATTEGVDKICLCAAGEQAGAIFYWDGHARPGQRNLHFLSNDFTAFIASLQADALSPQAGNA